MINGFIRIDKSNKEMFDNLADQTARVNSDNASPFKEGKKFVLSKEGYCFARSETTNKVGVVAILLDEDGNEQELWLSTLFKKGIEGGKPILNNSSIALEMEKCLNPSMSNKELGEAFVKLVGKKTIGCVRQPFIRTIPLAGGRFFEVVNSLVGFEFTE